MLSYQHIYHAGNLADVHKHAALARVLAYMTAKPKPLTYIETHAGRAMYDLAAPEALKTGEAATGVARAAPLLATDHPYRAVLADARALGGAGAYPGSPMVAHMLLRDDDRQVLAELHPQEVAALRAAMPWAEIHQADGLAMARSVTPPEPRRGLMLVDPSYEVKDDYQAMPRLMRDIHRKWPVGVLMLWYPLLASGAQRGMVAELDALGIDGAARHEVRFAPARPGHGMIGSGLFLVNPPWSWAKTTRELDTLFAAF